MKILIDGQHIIAAGAEIFFGASDEDFDKWNVLNEDGVLMYYVLDGNLQLVEVEAPEGFKEEAYLYIDGQLVKNPDWKKHLSPEERIVQLEETVANLNGNAVWDEMAVAIEEGVNEV